MRGATSVGIRPRMRPQSTIHCRVCKAADLLTCSLRQTSLVKHSKRVRCPVVHHSTLSTVQAVHNVQNRRVSAELWGPQAPLALAQMLTRKWRQHVSKPRRSRIACRCPTSAGPSLVVPARSSQLCRGVEHAC